MEWEYSRTWRKHWIDEDGTIYEEGLCNSFHLWDILNCTPYDVVNQYSNEGYDLYHKGKFIKHGKKVKELKIYVAEQVRKEN